MEATEYAVTHRRNFTDVNAVIIGNFMVYKTVISEPRYFDAAVCISHMSTCGALLNRHTYRESIAINRA